MERIRLIQIGIGGFGKRWLETVLNCPEVHLTAVVDVNENNRVAARDLLHGKETRIFEDYAGALEQVEADAVLIVTPPQTHVQIALKALERGLHVLMEKPLSYSVDEALEFYDVYLQLSTRQIPSKVVVNQNYRWTAPVQAVKTALSEGTVGDIAYVDWNFHRLHSGAEGTWRVGSPHFLFTDVSIHHFDLMRYLLRQEPISVSARAQRFSWSWCEGTMTGSAVFEFEKGIQAYYFGSLEDRGTQTPWTGNVRIVGTQGAIELTDDAPFLCTKDGGRVQLPVPDVLESKAYTLKEFVTYVQRGAVPHTTLDDNIRTFLMVQGVIQSSQSDGPVLYEVDNMLNRNRHFG